MRISALWHLFNVNWLTKRRLFDGWVGRWTDARRGARELSLLRSIRALGRLRERRAIPSLSRALADFDGTYMYDSVGSAAARALGEIGAAAAIPALLEVVREVLPSSNLVLESAAEALARIGDKDVEKTLMRIALGASETTAVADKVFRTDMAEARSRAVVRAVALMKGIQPPRPSEYASIPLARLLEGDPLPPEERRLPEAGDPSSSELLLADFADRAESRFSFSMQLLPGADRLSRARAAEEALEIATRAVMGRHGMTRPQAHRVRERYLAAQAK